MSDKQEALAALTTATEDARAQHDLLSFVEYCLANPSQRFWQALANWSDYAYIVGVMTSDVTILDRLREIPGADIRDTYHLERTPLRKLPEEGEHGRTH